MQGQYRDGRENLRGILLYPTAAKLYLADRPDLKPRSVERLELVARAIQRQHPDKRANQFTFEDLRTFVLFGDSGQPRADLTQSNYRSQLMSLFDWLAAEGHLVLNPAARLRVKVKPGRRPARSHRHNWLSTAAQQSVLDACTRDPEPLRGQRDRLLIKTGLLTGLRVHELAALQWGPGPVPANVVDLAGGRIVISVAKNDKPAIVGLPAVLVDDLHAFRAKASETAGRILAGSDPLFFRTRMVSQTPGVRETLRLRYYFDEPVLVEGLRRIVTSRGRAAGIATLAPHDLRRTFAKTLEDQGVPIEKISKALRHEDIGTTKRYLEQNPEKVTAIGQAIEVLIA